MTLIDFSKDTFGDLSLDECVEILTRQAKAVHGGDLRKVETMLTAQGSALNAIFGELARRAAVNTGQQLHTTEVYILLALKVQGQCRATLDTVAAIRNPPVFARQANINNGGQQQVNNGAMPPTVTHGHEEPKVSACMGCLKAPADGAAPLAAASGTANVSSASR